jgi:MSHA biogenesis protein MshQ
MCLLLPGLIPGLPTGPVGAADYRFADYRLAEYRLEECEYKGVAGEVKDSSDNGCHGTAHNGLTTAADDPARGDAADGTCRYGDFDGVDDYISLPGFPDLTDSFTITAWIYSRHGAADRRRDGRIFADDEHNSGGYGFSLGDGGAGRLRFFSRQVRPVWLDTREVIEPDTWYFVSAVHNARARSRKIYVNGLLVAFDHYTGAWGRDVGVAGIGGETDAAGSEAVSRWRFDGFIDEVRVYHRALPVAKIVAIMRESHPCPPCAGLPDHFAIIHDGTAVTCQGEPVTIVAHDVDHEVFVDFTGEIALSTATGRGDWVLREGHGTLDNGNADDGKAVYAFAGADAGRVGLDLYHREADEVDIDVAAEDIAEHPGEDPVLVFADAGFVFLGDGSVNGIGAQIAGKPSHRRPGNQTIELQAVILDTETGTCTAALTGDQKIELAVELLVPAAASAAQKVIVNNGEYDYDIALNTAGAVHRWTTVELDFGAAADSTAAFTFAAADAGKLRFHARAELTAPAAVAGLELAGTSNAIIVRPFGFEVYSTTPNAAATAGADSSVFRRAGEEFNLSARAVAWDNTDDRVDENGVPDDNADLTDNATTPAYAADDVALTAAAVLPAGGSAGVLGVSTVDFSSGTAATDAETYSEVGIVRFTCTDAGYMDEVGITITGTSAGIGRFIPDHFAVTANVPELAPLCSGAAAFTYLDQTFGFAVAPELTIIAVNSAGEETVNYRGDFCRLPASLTPTWENNVAGRVLLVNPPQNEADAVTLAADASRETVTFADTFAYAWEEITPFAADFDLVVDILDADGVRYEDADGIPGPFHLAGIGGLELRAGRLWLADNYGPADRDIVASPLAVQYFVDGSWQVHVDDHCTSGIGFDTARATMSSSPEIDLGMGALTVRHPADEEPEILRVTATAPAWLLVDDSVAAADFVFGIYRGNDRIIFRREGE